MEKIINVNNKLLFLHLLRNDWLLINYIIQWSVMILPFYALYSSGSVLYSYIPCRWNPIDLSPAPTRKIKHIIFYLIRVNTKHIIIMILWFISPVVYLTPSTYNSNVNNYNYYYHCIMICELHIIIIIYITSRRAPAL